MQLFSAKSARALLHTRGFSSVEAKTFANAYRLSYWMRLMPLPATAKQALISVIRRTPLDLARLRFNVGNTMIWGFAPIVGNAD